MHPRRITKLFQTMTHSVCQQLLHIMKAAKIDRPLLFATKLAIFNSPLNKMFKKRWNMVHNDKILYSLLPNHPFTAYNNHKTLKAIFS